MTDFPWHVESSSDNPLGAFTSNIPISLVQFPKLKEKQCFFKTFFSWKVFLDKNNAILTTVLEKVWRKPQTFPPKMWNTIWEVFFPKKMLARKTIMRTQRVEFWQACQKNLLKLRKQLGKIPIKNPGKLCSSAYRAGKNLPKTQK